MDKSNVHTLIKKIRTRIKASIKLSKDVSKLMDSDQHPSQSFLLSIERVKKFTKFLPSQKDSEIKLLMDLIHEGQFTNICEIGGFKGGSLYLFCRAAPSDASVISIDINYPIERRVILKRFAGPGQRVFCIQGDSTDHHTYLKTKRLLNGKKLDLLFIDGDHSFFGVMNDFVRYAPLVKSGGIIALHDIHPDSLLRFRVKTASYVGEVPIFWSCLKKVYTINLEFIENTDQDGMGLGIIYKQ